MTTQIFPKHKFFNGEKYQKYEGWTTSKRVAHSTARALRKQGYLARVASERAERRMIKYYCVYRRKKE